MSTVRGFHSTFIKRLSLMGMLASAGTACVPYAYSQVTTATITAVVTDKDGDIIPKAKVVVTNRGNKFTRTAIANGSGIVTFAGLDSGDYSVQFSSPGFSTYVIDSIHLDPSDTRNINTVKMVPGADSQTITVTTSGENHVDDDGSRSAVITAADLNKLSLEGREVTELLKILPGSAINTGIGNGTASSNSTFDPAQVGFGGAAGSYSMSGSPINGVAIRSDGANLTDPGSGAGALQTINAEATAEVKVQTSNFGADNANGPLVISAVGKAGAANFHGSVYAYGRTKQLNSTDSLAILLGTTKPPDRYIYPGLSLGGPVLIPGTQFNHSKHLTFFLSGEDYIQRNVYAYNSVSNAVIHALVPTPEMLHGDFSLPVIKKYLPPGVKQYACDPTLQVVCQNLNNIVNPQTSGTYQNPLNNFNNLYQVPVSTGDGQAISCKGVAGDCLAGHFDPGAVAQFRLFPLPNTPDGSTTAQGYNYTHTDLVDSDIYQVHGRMDYEKGKSKFYINYTAENGVTNVPQAEGYFASGNSGGVNTPGGSLRTTYTGSGSFNWNYTLSASTNNEAFVSGLYSDAIDTPGQPNLLFNSAIGYPYTGAYANGTKEFPDLETYGTDGLPLGFFPDYSFGPLYNKTFAPGVGDNFSKQIGKHTAKAGFNIERPRLNGTLTNNGGTPSNGATSEYYVGPQFLLPADGTSNGEPYVKHYSTCFQPSDANCGLSQGNSNNLANYLVGDINSYTQTNGIPHIRMHAWTTSMFVTDDWKVLRNLSLNIGLRVEHIGRWTDDHGFGAAVFNPTLYFNEKDNLNSTMIPLPGFRWHANDSSIPLGGFPTRLFFYEPRVGFNWDVYGDAKTTLSGGYGQYRFRDGQQDAINSVQASNGLRQVSISNPGNDPQHPNIINQGGLTAAYIQTLQLSPKPGVETSTFFAQNGNNYPTATSNTFYAVDRNDDQTALTTNYSLTVTQQFPKGLTFSVGYVGNRSQYLLDDDGNGPTISNINALPVGALFLPDPNPQSSQYQQVFNPSNVGNYNPGAAQNDYRTYNRYGSIQVERHILTAHYNGLQATLEKSKGSLYLKANYTYSKNYGQRGGYSNGNAGDSFNLANDYGPLAYDRRHIANLSYNYDFGSRYHGYRVVRPLVNGWQINGITNLQSGPDLLATNYTTNFNLGGFIPSTGNGNPVFPLNNVSFLGTPDVQLQPIITCNPTANLAPRHYVNPACFSLPAQGGQNGTFRPPYITAPTFFESDLTLVKDFKLREQKQFEARLAAFNFLNYKLKTFSNVDQGELSLSYQTGGFANDSSFGRSIYNSGRRILEASIKYSF